MTSSDVISALFFVFYIDIRKKCYFTDWKSKSIRRYVDARPCALWILHAEQSIHPRAVLWEDVSVSQQHADKVIG